MFLRILLFPVLMWLLGTSLTSAQSSAERILPLDAQIAADGRSVELSWFNAKPPRVGSVTVKRRLYGQTGGETWQTLANDQGPIMRYRDATITTAVAYEYQVLRTARDIVDVGYWLAGTEIAARDMRGTAHMVIDQTIAEDLSPWLDRFVRDLVGDGWRVRRYSVPRGQPGRSRAQTLEAWQTKERLRTAYKSDPFGQHAVILIGHVQVVYSGRANPDGHDLAPHATDLFYAEMDGQWQSNTDGLLIHNAIPSDFIEMQIGRIDFSGLAGGNRNTELQFLRAYFDKNHHWRRGFLGDLRSAYGDSHTLTVDRTGLRNVVGPDFVRTGGHHDIGEERPWLWGVDFGDHNGANYQKAYKNKAVFTINFGSAKQRFDGRLNAMVTLLAQPWYTLAVGWGGRPSWWPHHMALGGSVGKVHLRTVNNGRTSQPYRDSMDYFPTGDYLWRNPVWVNLLGDPTLRAFPMAPPQQLTAQKGDQGIVLSWQPSPDAGVMGYKIYRSPANNDDFALLNSKPIKETTFTDTNPQDGARYMVRAYGLKRVYAGSFYTSSAGIFSAEIPLPESSMDMAFNTVAGQPVTLPEVFTTHESGLIHALVHAPSRGTLSHDGTNWVYTPPADFEGVVLLDFSISTAWKTARGNLSIVVTQPPQ